MRKSNLLLFLHISKTGGTSLSDAVGRLFPADRIFMESRGNNLTVDYVQGLEGRLGDGGFIAGHAGLGVITLLRERADIMTMLRNPEDQVISNYLHARSDPTSPLHEDANNLSFADYIERHPYHLVVQAGSLYYGISQAEVNILDVIGDKIDYVFEFMESMLFVGVLERADESCAVLSRLLNAEYPLRLPHLNTATARGGVSPRDLDALREQYRQLSRRAHLAPLFDIEARVYAKACALLDRHSVGEGIDVSATDTGSRIAGSTIPPQRFFSATSSLDAGRLYCPLDGVDDCLIYGPYDRLAPGAYKAEFCFELLDVAPDSDRSILIEVVANARHTLARRRLRGPGPFSPRRRTLTFADRDGSGVLEFRIYGTSPERGRLVFDGVRIHPAKGAFSRMSASLSRRVWSARSRR